MMEQKWWQIIVPRIRLEDSNRPLEHTPGIRQNTNMIQDFQNHKQLLFQGYVGVFLDIWTVLIVRDDAFMSF